MAKYNFPADARLVDEQFQKFFGIPAKDYIDHLISALERKFIVDILKLDDYLHEKFGDYDHGDHSISMKALVIREYGKEASKFIENLM